MSKQASASYNPREVEPKWRRRWEEERCFEADPDERLEPYCVMIPPPNVTGILTMGHVLNNTIQDMLVRRARQRGKRALWQPGTDHASIATQIKVEQALAKEGKSKQDLGREVFVRRCWEWSERHGGIILEQLAKLGASCDWRRKVFTMDEGYSRAVLTAFVELHRRGYLYRGKYMTKWCPVSRTALSDEEVVMRPQKGRMYRMRYEIVEEPGTCLEIATTRPETIMGDTGVAVHPSDERYRHLVGKHCWRPFPREAIPIVADEAVDREFGTGALKVTPAHDPLDYEIGQRQGLPVLDVFNDDATLNELAGEPFVGMDRFEARKAAAAKLEELGLLVATEPYENSVGFSQRADAPIEPRLTDQWWLRYPKIEEAKRAVEKELVRFHPQRWVKVYLRWLEGVRDWPISRQLWWGHRIPVWYRKGADRSDPASLHVSVDGPEDPENWERDEDVLDTWASSWLWPFATLGWPSEDPAKRRDLDYFYPTGDLVTGPDIIFFWVARMIVAGLEFTGERKERLDDEEIARRIPFRNVYWTGMIRDMQGRKMSKSLGNSPDPLDLIETYGADGLRFGIMNIAPKGSDILFSEERVEIGRNFCNKLWNACRFRRMSGAAPEGACRSAAAIAGRIEAGGLDDFDHWILARSVDALEQIDRLYETYELSQLTHALFALVWGDFCDWYVEASKPKLQDAAARETCLAIQDWFLRIALQLLHPVTPHATEELWESMGFAAEGERLALARLPAASELAETLRQAGVAIDRDAAGRVERLKELIAKARSIKADRRVAAKRDVTFLFKPADETARAAVEANAAVVKSLAGAKAFEFVERADDASGAVADLGTVYLDLASAVDAAAERERLGRELEKLEKAIAAGERKLGNESFLSKAPAAVVEGARRQLAETRAKRDEIQRLLARL